MSKQENQELNKLLMEAKQNDQIKAYRSDEPDIPPHMEVAGGFNQWTTGDEKIFFPAAKTASKLIPGVYEIKHSNVSGIFFEKVPVKTEGLLRFPQTNSDKVLEEIKNFWKKEKIFKEYDICYKRGIVLWGPPGGGKTSLLQLIMHDVVERQGIVIKFCSPSLFVEGMRIFREVQPDSPVVVLMEDIDSILDIYNESEVLNVLDGIDNMKKIVFLSTTNYPERLGARILNRPSRFDKHFKIGYPNDESRMIYLKHLIGEKNLTKIDLDKWVRDTVDFTIAHLKELFIAVIILKDDYEEAIENLKSMQESISSSDFDGPIGFLSNKKACY